MKNIFSPETGFAIFMNTLGNIIWTGLLWVLFSIPLITMGAASCAAYEVTVKVIRGGKGYVTDLFFQSFKENFLVSMPVQIIAILIIGVLGFDCIYLYGYGTEFSQTLSIILYMFVAVFVAVIIYIYPTMQRFDESQFELFKLAFYMTFRHFISTIGLLIIFLTCLYALYLLPWSFFIVPGLWWYLQSFLLEPIVKSFSTVEEDDESEEADDAELEDSEESDIDENESGNLQRNKPKRNRSKADDSMVSYNGFRVENEENDEYEDSSDQASDKEKSFVDRIFRK